MVVSTKTLKHENKKSILNLIELHGPTTFEEIMSKRKVSRPTVVNIVKELEESNLVSKVGQEVSTNVGRNPTLFDINTSYYFGVGVDMEFPEIRISFMNLKSEVILTKNFVASHTKMHPQDVLDNIVSTINTMCEELNEDIKNCIGIGVGISGLINSQFGISAYSERANWKNVNIKKYLNEQLGVDVSVKNDVHQLALLEKKYNKHANDGDFIYLAVRYGLGAAIFINGQPYHGMAGNAGFIGHTTIDCNGEQCQCGNKGCLELYISEPNVTKKYRELSGNKSDKLSMEEIFRRSSTGDKAAETIKNEVAHYLCIGINNIVNLLDIENVIICGLPLPEEDDFFELLNEKIKEKRHRINAENVMVHLGVIEPSQCSIGCALSVVETFFANY